MPLIRAPQLQYVDTEGVPWRFAKAYFSLTGTTTPVEMYQDEEFTIPHADPVVADALGLFPPIHFDPALGLIRCRIITETGDLDNPPIDADPVNDVDIDTDIDAGSNPFATFRISLSSSVSNIYAVGTDPVLEGTAIFDSVDFDTDSGSASLTRNLNIWFSAPGAFPVASYVVPTAGYYQFVAAFSLYSNTLSDTWGFFAQLIHLTADQAASTDSFGTNVTQTFGGAVSATENVSIIVIGYMLCEVGDIIFPNIIANHAAEAGITLNGGGGPPGPFLPTFFAGQLIAPQLLG